MNPTLCILGGCNGAGKTTLARELLPRLGLMRFLNADEMARGLSPLDPSLSAFRAGRLVLEEARALVAAKASFAIKPEAMVRLETDRSKISPKGGGLGCPASKHAERPDGSRVDP